MAWRIAAPSDIDDNEQPITLAHFFDVAYHHHWLVQFNPFEGLSTKPPLYHWMGGIVLWMTGNTHEWGLKLASLLPWAITTGLVVACARTCLSRPGAWLAGGFWVATFHSVKLGYTARPDMAMAMFMTLAIWAMLKQRTMWHDTPLEPTPRSYWLYGGIFWLAGIAACLTKGPPGLMVATLMLVMLTYDRAWRPRNAWMFGAGLTLVILIPLAWLALTIHAHPEWNQVLDDELWDRLTGEETRTKIYPPRWRELPYFVGRFAPWSVLVIVAMGVLPWWRRVTSLGRKSLTARLAGRVQWAALWVIVVLGLLALPEGRRADHIFPVHVGAAVLASAMVLLAHRGHREVRLVTHLLLGAVLIGAPLATIVAWQSRPATSALPWVIANVPVVAPRDLTRVILISCGVVAGLSFVIGIIHLHRRRYHAAAWAALFAMASIIGLFNAVASKAAQAREGEMAVALARTASDLAQQENRQPLFYDTGYTPVQSLMGAHQSMLPYKPIEGPALLITSDQGWQTLERAGAAGTILLQTPTMSESKRSLILIRPTYLPWSLPDIDLQASHPLDPH